MSSRRAVMPALRSHFDDEVLKRTAGSVRHPLTRALLVLTFTTGLVDAVSYLGLGRVFTANMTGNVVLLAFGIAGSGGLPVVGPVISLAGFLVGAATGGRLVRSAGTRHLRLVTWALGVEVCVISLAAVLAAATDVHPGRTLAYVLIVVLAAVMGFRSAAVRRIAVPDLSTTVVTMTLAGLAADSPLSATSRQASIRRLAAVSSMLVGALAGALLLRIGLFVPLLAAAGLAMVTWLVYIPAAIDLLS